MLSQFRFSPRPNRAHEIRWRDFDKEAFETAREQGKLILLSISAVWCHWCHVMDERTYSDSEVIDIINSSFVPIRVDADQRPDVNSRYNMGGWPATAILTPDGRILTGGTFIPPTRMKRLLKNALSTASQGAVNSFTGVTESDQSHNHDDEKPVWNPLENTDVDVHHGVDVDDGQLWDIYEWIRDDLIKEYDPEYGGFGTQPKFPMPDALRLAMFDYMLTGNPLMKEILTHSLEAMIGGGIYDQVEGGFFRYSTTRDWEIPHFEKMLEDNSMLLHLLVDTHKLTGEETFLKTALGVLRYMKTHLYQEETKAFCGSQDADERYYSMDAATRCKVAAPLTDRNVYAAWNALAVRAMLNLWTATNDDSQLSLALTVADTLRSWLYDPKVGVYHYFDPEAGVVKTPLTLNDQLRFIDMCLSIFQATGDKNWCDDADHLINLVLSNHRGSNGLLFDIQPQPDAPEPLLAKRYDFHENSRAVSTLATASAVFGKDHLREAGQGILRALKLQENTLDVTAAEYALAIQDALQPWTKVTVVGAFSSANGAGMRDFLRILHSKVRPQLAVVPLDPVEDETAIKHLGISIDQMPIAIACVGRKCLKPETDPEALLMQLDETGKREQGATNHEQEDHEQRGQQITYPDLDYI